MQGICKNHQDVERERMGHLKVSTVIHTVWDDLVADSFKLACASVQTQGSSSTSFLTNYTANQTQGSSNTSSLTNCAAVDLPPETH